MRKLLLLTTVLVAACQTRAEVDTPDYSALRGEQVFGKHCAACHGDSGQGIEPWYPSLQRLAGLREADEMIETVITGRFRRGGELNGHTIPIMPAWGQLSDADVAGIVNFIQLNWGQGGQVTIQDVSATRARLWELD
jgi:mono/diheme cytochrome c family protein